MTQKKKSDGTDQWDYTWNQENRLTQAKHTVSGSVVKTITYGYDCLGRMLSRSDGTTTTKFTWDGWDCVQETDGTNVTTWMIPEGQLLSFIRGGSTYQVHTDALGSVRLVTDSTGAVKARFDYGAWSELLSSSFDNVPNGGMPYRFVGSVGIRWDPDISLHYMRSRWYDSGLQRFISRDAVGLRVGSNQYRYVKNNPSIFIDLLGKQQTSTASGIAQGLNNIRSGYGHIRDGLEIDAVGGEIPGTIDVIYGVGKVIQGTDQILKQVDIRFPTPSNLPPVDPIDKTNRNLNQNDSIGPNRPPSVPIHMPILDDPGPQQPHENGPDLTKLQHGGHHDDCHSDDKCQEAHDAGIRRANREMIGQFHALMKIRESLSKDLVHCNAVGFENFHSPSSGYWGG